MNTCAPDEMFQPVVANARRSRLVDGLIVPPSHLELIAVDHCNITCGGCNHASPAMPAWFADPDAVYRDFSVLAKVYRPTFLKVLGGEPLMHKNLALLLDAVRAAGMAGKLMLVTNGVLLHRAPDAVWEAVDEIEISVYPGVQGLEDNIRLARERMKAMGKRLSVYHYGQFRATFSLKGTADQALVRKVYASCKIANFWGCHGVRDGYFYKCPQSMYAGRLVGGIAESDRIALVDGPALQAALLAFVNSPQPLSACTHCVGTVGIQEAHTLPARARWRAAIDRTSEELIDYDWLEKSLAGFDEPDDCKVKVHAKKKGILNRWPWLRRLRGQSAGAGATPLSPGRRTIRIAEEKKR